MRACRGSKMPAGGEAEDADALRIDFETFRLGPDVANGPRWASPSSTG